MRTSLHSLANTTTSLKEVGGEGALYHEAADVEGLTAHMIRVSADDALRNELSALGLKNATRFRWENHARDLLGVYREVLQVTATPGAPRLRSVACL